MWGAQKNYFRVNAQNRIYEPIPALGKGLNSFLIFLMVAYLRQISRHRLVTMSKREEKWVNEPEHRKNILL